MKHKNNVYYCLFDREYGVTSNYSRYRHNLRILRKLCCKKDSRFEKVWTKTSGRGILYECGKIYTDNCRNCYTVCGIGGVPQLLYSLPKCPTSQKIEDSLLTECALADTNLPNGGWRGSFYALTAHNWLYRYDSYTGSLLQRVYLSTKYKFRHLTWNVMEHSIVIKSTHNKLSVLARQAGVPQRLVLALAIFKLYPLQFTGMLEVTRNVFGRDVTDAMVSHDVLLVMHSGGVVKLYSIETILKESMCVDPVNLSESDGQYGSYPTGLPLNIVLKECPPLLMKVKCAEHNLSLGGVPWHYIITPYGAEGYFHVHSVASQQMAVDGSLDMGTVSLEPDKCMFHPDDSGRILHIGSNDIRVLELREQDGLPTRRVKPVYSISGNMKENQSSQGGSGDGDQYTYSSSGRVIRRTSYRDDDTLYDCQIGSIQGVEYENELDMLAVSKIHLDGDSYRGVISIHDNLTGTLIKDVPLREPWKEFHEHVIALDWEYLVHISKGPKRQTTCHIYRLKTSPESETDLSPRTSSSRRHRTRNSSSRNFHRVPNNVTLDAENSPGSSIDSR